MEEVGVEGWRGVPDEEEDMGEDGLIESPIILQLCLLPRFMLQESL